MYFDISNQIILLVNMIFTPYKCEYWYQCKNIYCWKQCHSYLLFWSNNFDIFIESRHLPPQVYIIYILTPRAFYIHTSVSFILAQYCSILLYRHLICCIWDLAQSYINTLCQLPLCPALYDVGWHNSACQCEQSMHILHKINLCPLSYSCFEDTWIPDMGN